MNCQKCARPAIVHLTEVVSESGLTLGAQGKGKRTVEIHLCLGHAVEAGLIVASADVPPQAPGQAGAGRIGRGSAAHGDCSGEQRIHQPGHCPRLGRLSEVRDEVGPIQAVGADGLFARLRPVRGETAAAAKAGTGGRSVNMWERWQPGGRRRKRSVTRPPCICGSNCRWPSTRKSTRKRPRCATSFGIWNKIDSFCRSDR